jgi:hypothetical protein
MDNNTLTSYSLFFKLSTMNRLFKGFSKMIQAEILLAVVLILLGGIIYLVHWLATSSS